MSDLSIRDFLKEDEAFKRLEGAVLDKFIEEIKPVQLEAGQVLFERGDQADSVYILATGKLKVSLATDTGALLLVGDLHPHDIVGEIGFLTGQTRSASITAEESSQVLGISRSGFQSLAQDAPAIVDALSRQVRERIQRTQLAVGLYQVFGLTLSEPVLQGIVAQVEWLTLPSGAPIFHENDASDALYFVVSGLLRQVSAGHDGEEIFHREVRSGDTVGLVALLTGHRHTTSVYAVRHSIVVKLSAALFEQMTKTVPEMALPIMRLLSFAAAGAAASGAHTRQPSFTYALVPLQPDLPLKELAGELMQIMERWGSTLYVGSDDVTERFADLDIANTPVDSPLNAALANWISQNQAEHTFVFLPTDSEWTHWSQTCVQFADRIILVGRSDAPQGWRRLDIEKAIAQQVPHTRTELVLLHPPETQTPNGTSQWLAERKLHTHHHVRMGDQKHHRRLARRLCERGIGLVLSGGGARGFGHIGVIRALEEAGVEIDMVAGTSIGAVVGGVYTFDANYDELVHLSEHLGTNEKIFDRTLPFVALNRSRKVTEIYQHVYSDKTIEDAWRPFFCIASNLGKAQATVIQHGDLALAVRASSAIPGVFTPVYHGEDVVVDGGLTNNFPVDVMRRKVDGGTVIGVNVSPFIDKGRKYDLGTDVSGWNVLLRRLNPFQKKRRVPSAIGILFRSLEINTVEHVRSAWAVTDLFIEVNLSHFSGLNFAQHEALISESYEAAQPQIEEWLRRTSTVIHFADLEGL